MTTYTFVIPGPPVAKGRPKFAMRGGKGMAYTPEKTRAWEKAARLIVSAGMKGNPPLEGPIDAELWFGLPRPKTVKRKHPAVKSDIDNFIKNAFDAMNGIAFVDDCQVVRVNARKEYSFPPMVIIKISTVDD